MRAMIHSIRYEILSPHDKYKSFIYLFFFFQPASTMLQRTKQMLHDCLFKGVRAATDGELVVIREEGT